MFRPIKITLNTQEELEQLKQILANVNLADLFGGADALLNMLVGDLNNYE